ncbi:hypothetical protein HYALB_00012705 [Hymenoscyphus albidus]|uniref:Uncharacterized protein n=1 Tax=Hymenoscyphus albidus TaxID=595503 RepID=A0A9N9LSF4_9HELO|nr:hypothetical protein HYALB_00012705 [Hymenoscyphus albidus]
MAHADGLGELKPSYSYGMGSSLALAGVRVVVGIPGRQAEAMEGREGAWVERSGGCILSQETTTGDL